MLIIALLVLQFVSLLLSKCINELFAVRLPVFIIGIATYIYRKENNKLLTLYSISLIFALVLGKYLLVFSMSMPLIIYGLSFFISHLPLHKPIEFTGKHSLEIYLSQSIATKFFLRDYYIHDAFFTTLCSIAIIIVGAFAIYFIQLTFNKVIRV